MNFEDALKGVGKNRKTLLIAGAGAVALLLGYVYLKNANANSPSSGDPTASLLASSPVAYGVPSAYGATNAGVGDLGGQGGTTGTGDLAYLQSLLQFQEAQATAQGDLATLQANNDLALGNASIASNQTIALANIAGTQQVALDTLAGNVSSNVVKNGVAALSGAFTAGAQSVDYTVVNVARNTKLNVPLISASSLVDTFNSSNPATGAVGSGGMVTAVPSINLPGGGAPLAAGLPQKWYSGFISSKLAA